MKSAELVLQQKVKPKGPQTETAAYSLPPRLVRLIEKAAEKTGSSKSEIVKIALETFFSEELVAAQA